MNVFILCSYACQNHRSEASIALIAEQEVRLRDMHTLEPQPHQPAIHGKTFHEDCGKDEGLRMDQQQKDACLTLCRLTYPECASATCAIFWLLKRMSSVF